MPFVCGESGEHPGAWVPVWIIGCSPFWILRSINCGRPSRIPFGRREGARCIGALSIAKLGLCEVVELDDALAAIDVAKARGACLDAKEGKTPVVGAAVVLADADHMLESCFAHGIARLGIVC